MAKLIDGLSRGGLTVGVAFLGKLDESDRGSAGAGLAGLCDLGFEPPDPPFGSPLDAFDSGPVASRFWEIARRLRPSAILVEYVRFAYVAEHAATMADPRPLLILDTHDVMHERAASFAAHGASHWVAIDRATESRALEPFDAVVAIQHADARTLRSMGPDGARVVVAPHAIDGPADPPGWAGPSAGFIGVDNAPNTDALRTITDQIMPRVRRDVPEASLTVAGGVSRRVDAPTAWADAIGELGDLAPFHRRYSVMLNPVRMGGGLKIKNVEALAHGRPVVTTPLGAAGLEEGAGRCVLVRESARELAACTRALLSDRDRWESAAASALELARARFSVDAAPRELLGLVRAWPVTQGAAA